MTFVIINSLHAWQFFMLLLLSLEFFSKLTFFKNFFQELYQSVKRFGSRSGSEVIKLFSCSTQLSTKFILLINVKMPTFFGILTFVCRINTTLESLEARKIFIFQCFTFFEQLTFHVQLS